MTGIDIAEVCKRLADRRSARTEADVQSDVRTLLLYGGLSLDDAEVRLETPAPGRRRIDVEVGSAVIEVKRDLRKGSVLQEARDQLAGYVQDRSVELARRYVGLLTDGAEWRLHNLRDGQLVEVARFDLNPKDPDARRLVIWLESVLATAERIPPAPAEIVARLGARSPAYQLDVADLTALYAASRSQPEVQLKRELWSRLLAAALGTNFVDTDELFINHTYLVLVGELVAHAAVGFDLADLGVDAVGIVSGELFRRSGIGGVVESDFFDWPAEQPAGDPLVRSLATRLARFDWSNVEHDVLKVLYESVIDDTTRQRLGEYYTPDWIAEFIVDEVVDDPLNNRVLDPACGSGTFLFWALRRYLAEADKAAIPNREAVAGAVSHVFGIDLHPVAVTLARVTYLLALGAKRLQGDRAEFSVPVYLGDSVQFEQDASALTAGGVTVSTTDGAELFARDIYFPERVLADVENFDRLVSYLAGLAQDPAKRPNDLTITLNRYKVDPADREAVTVAYNLLCDLHDKRRNHIWGYYVRNLARPVWFSRAANRVDRLVGNPPWLKYNAMTAAMQKLFRLRSVERNLWGAANVVTSQDLAGLFVARSCELYLTLGGRFGFVMPAASLSRPQYLGFRSGNYSHPGAVTTVEFPSTWDLTGVDPDPFPVPACVITGVRTDQAAKPLPTDVSAFVGRLPDHHRGAASALSFLAESSKKILRPEDVTMSPYGVLARQGANLVPRVFFAVTEQPAPAIGLPAGQVRVQSRRVVSEREPWKSMPDQSGTVEADYIYKMLLGESLLPFFVGPSPQAVIPWIRGHVADGQDPVLDAAPGLADWWRRSQAGWEQNKAEATTKTLREQIDHQGKLTRQFPIAPVRVVFTGRGSTPVAAVVTDERAIVDHALYWMPVSSVEEGSYLVAVLNSAVLHRLVEGLLSVGQFGVRNIHRNVLRAPIPMFEPETPLHVRLAQLGAEAAQAVAQVPLGQTISTADARSAARAALQSAGLTQRLDLAVSELLGV